MQQKKLKANFSYKVYRHYNGLYSVECPEIFDLCLLFARYQEYYESCIEGVKNSTFDLLNWIREYSINHSTIAGVFTYTMDWGGFNIPGSSLNKSIKTVTAKDFNMYDQAMMDIVFSIKKDLALTGRKKYYIIGLEENSDLETLNHEVAHSLYYLNPAYKKSADQLLTKNLTKKKQFKKWLKENGYAEEVLEDECQAYFSTGMPDRFTLKGNWSFLKDYKENFETYNKEYNKQNNRVIILDNA